MAEPIAPDGFTLRTIRPRVYAVQCITTGDQSMVTAHAGASPEGIQRQINYVASKMWHQPGYPIARSTDVGMF